MPSNVDNITVFETLVFLVLAGSNELLQGKFSHKTYGRFIAIDHLLFALFQASAATVMTTRLTIHLTEVVMPRPLDEVPRSVQAKCSGDVSST